MILSTTKNLFNRIWQSVAFSNLSDGCLRIILPFIALSIATTPSDVANTIVFLTLGWPLFGLIAGYIVDKYKNTYIPFYCHSIRSLSLLVLVAIYYFEGLSLYYIYIAAFIYSFFDVLFEASMPLLVYENTTKENRSQSNSKLAATHTVSAEFCGPAIGAAVITLSPLFGLLLVVCLYAYSAALMLNVSLARSGNRNLSDTKTRENVLRNEKGQNKGLFLRLFWSETSKSVKFLYGHKLLFRLSLIGACLAGSWSAWLALEAYHLIEQEPITATKFEFGIMMSMLAVGAIMTAFLSGKILSRASKLKLLYFDVAGTTILLIVSSLTKNVYLIGSALVFAGIGATLWASIVITMRQELVPLQMISKVNALFRVICYGAMPFAAFIAGLLANHLPISQVFQLFAVGCISLVFPLYKVVCLEKTTVDNQEYM